MKIYIPTEDGKPFKRGRILRHLADALVREGVQVSWTDEAEAPDCYIVEAILPPLRHHRPVIVHAENLIGDRALEYTHRDVAAIVFNSEWLRRLYRNTFQYELPTAWTIPPAFDDRRAYGWYSLYLEDEIPILTCAKWAKRPYKRLPLHCAVLQEVRRFGHDMARLHVFGWEPTMPYYHSRPRYWRDMPLSGVRVHQRSFERMTYPTLLQGATLLLHLSAIDSGPQTVMEAIARGIPAVVSNNMGAAEWIREIGPEAGEVVEIDPVTETYEQVKAITDPRFCGPDAWKHAITHPIASRRFARVCSSVEGAAEVAAAVGRHCYPKRRYTPPREFTMNGIVQAWLDLIYQVIGRRS